LLEFLESGMNLKVRCWIENYVDLWVSLDQLNTAIYKCRYWIVGLQYRCWFYWSGDRIYSI